jgi:chromosomal replication initiator protein
VRVALTERIEQTSEVARAWTRVRAHLRESAGARLFDQWLKPIALVETGDADTVRLSLPSAFMTNWVRNHYADRLVHEFRAILPQVRSVTIDTARPGEAPVVLSVPAPVAAGIPIVKIAIEQPVLDPRYTFERFVVDASNKVAFNAAKALAEPGPVRFSPLFLHSGTGQGKTHLMHAIGHAFLAAQPGARVVPRRNRT